MRNRNTILSLAIAAVITIGSPVPAQANIFQRFKGYLDDLVDDGKQILNDSDEGAARNGRPHGAKSGVDADGNIHYSKDNILDQMGGSNLTKRAEAGEFNHLFCDKKMMDDIMVSMMNLSTPSVMLTAPPGVGKTTVAQCLARELVTMRGMTKSDFDDMIKSLRDSFGNVTEAIARETGASEDEILKNFNLSYEANLERWNSAEIIQFEITNLKSDTSLVGQAESKIKAFSEKLEESPNIIPFLEEAHLIKAGGGRNNGPDIGNMLKPILTSGKVRFLAATTDAEYDQFWANDGALRRRFVRIQIPVPNDDEALQMLIAQKQRWERVYGITIPNETLATAVAVSNEFLPALAQPARAIRILEEAVAAKSVHGLRINPEAHPILRGLRQLDREIGELKGRTDETSQRLLAEKTDEAIQTHGQYESMRSVFQTVNPLAQKVDNLRYQINNLTNSFKSKQTEMLKKEKEFAEAAEQGLNPNPYAQDVERLQQETAEMNQQLEKLIMERAYLNGQIAESLSDLNFGTLTDEDIYRQVARMNNLDEDIFLQSAESRIGRIAESLRASLPQGSDEIVQQIEAPFARRLISRRGSARRPVSFIMMGGRDRAHKIARIIRQTGYRRDNILEFDLNRTSSNAQALFGTMDTSLASADLGAITKAIQMDQFQVIVLDNWMNSRDPKIYEFLSDIFTTGTLQLRNGNNLEPVNFSNSVVVLTGDWPTPRAGNEQADALIKKIEEIQNANGANQTAGLIAMAAEMNPSLRVLADSRVARRIDGTIRLDGVVQADDLEELLGPALDVRLNELLDPRFTVEVSEKAKKLMAKIGKESNLDLDQALDEMVEGELMDLLARAQLQEGPRYIVDAADDQLTIRIAE